MVQFCLAVYIVFSWCLDLALYRLILMNILLLADQRSNSIAKSKKAQHELPPPRLSGNIQVTFTPRIFPTALRESKLPEEEEVSS